MAPLVATVGLDAMRDGARCDDPLSNIWVGGADQFFYKGSNGRWRRCSPRRPGALRERRGQP